tara:strand:+ start:425 stop:1237 length:813 start_codon:yes stop_codon:yes gene_type:complete
MIGLGLALAKQDFLSGVSFDFATFNGIEQEIVGTGSSPYIWTDAVTQDLSFSFWIRIDSTAKENQEIIFLGDTNLDNQIKINYNAANNTLDYIMEWGGVATHSAKIQLHDAANQSTTGITSSATGWTNSQGSRNSDGFINVTITFDASSDMSGVKFYWNGTEISGGIITATTGVTKADWDASILGLANDGSASNQADILKGALDEVKFYSSVLSSTDVHSIYNSGTPINASTAGVTSSLITEWTLNGTVNDSAGKYDTSGSANNVTFDSY